MQQQVSEDINHRNMAFKSINPIFPGRSVFDLSYSKMFTCELGDLIPVACEAVVPGDHFTMGHEAVIRFQPLINPILHQIDCYSYSFFVPYRLLWSGWETFITGGPNGTDSSTIPRWTGPNFGTDWTFAQLGKLWDYMGWPIGSNSYPSGNFGTADVQPEDFPRRAYYMIWNEWWRDQTLQAPIDIADQTYQNIMKANWEKDYLTSALPWQQRGNPLALPIVGSTSANWNFSNNPVTVGQEGGGLSVPIGDAHDSSGTVLVNDSGSPITGYPLKVHQAGLNQNTVDLSMVSSVNISELRLAWQVQRFLERNARGGVRYVEFINNHFGVHLGDERVARPIYIGGSKSPVIVSEVLQTSESTANSPQANMAGHAISVSSNVHGSYFVPEFGLIMTVMVVRPKPVYDNVMDRQFMHMNRYEFYSPEFANLSEQAVYGYEVSFDSGHTANIFDIWGYQGRFNELRSRKNVLAGLMRVQLGSYTAVPGSLSQWHLARSFDSYPALSDSFLQCNPDKRIFAVDTEPGLMINWANIIKAVRPLPIIPNPGLVDHD